MLVIDKDTPNVADLKSLKGIEKFTYLRNIYITGATMLEGKSISRNSTEGAEQEIIDWIDSLGLLKATD